MSRADKALISIYFHLIHLVTLIFKSNIDYKNEDKYPPHIAAEDIAGD